MFGEHIMVHYRCSKFKVAVCARWALPNDQLCLHKGRKGFTPHQRDHSVIRLMDKGNGPHAMAGGICGAKY